MRPKNICIIPMITANFIFKEFVNEILFDANAQAFNNNNNKLPKLIL